ncbi:MAG: glycogen debranching protein GlgX [Uliginosibacterium sp.]|nr:glycogen debranching protein GlgX [Uliginosibacterium sp.]
METRLPVSLGKPHPLGVSVEAAGVNVAVVSRHAERILFCLFDDTGQYEIARLPLPGRLGEVHHGFIAGVQPGARYGLRADGPWLPDHGHRFDPAKLLLDPYADTLDRAFEWHTLLASVRASSVDTAQWVPKAIVGLAWTPAPRPTPRKPGFIYELSVRAFTRRHPGIPPEIRGTVAALAHPEVIAHLKRIGVDTIELMPLMAWIDERHLHPLGLRNAWGYNPVSFFAPDPRLAPGGLAEIRAAIAALHEAGFQVILDVVFNHTGESDKFGGAVSLRGLDNALYYRHVSGNPGVLVNDTGCGNTLALDQAPVLKLVMDALRHWVIATGVDGFRFDLATVLGRLPHGFDSQAPLLAAIRQDPLLSTLTLIAEPWDIGPGGYQLGAFGAPWHEWNDHYRDEVRRFWRGDYGMVGALATRIAGSSDLFHGSHRPPSASINFIAAHDGFSLRDMLSFSAKHNHANGENNADGKNHEVAWNCGVEGETSDPQVLSRRQGDARALLATLLLSRGTPMLTAGDEFGRTQHGNNNAYAQDNETTWLDWQNADHALSDFVGQLAELRRRYPPLAHDAFLKGRADSTVGIPDAVWLRADGIPMRDEDWCHHALQHIGLALLQEDCRVLLWLNAAESSAPLKLPPARTGYAWQQVLNSSSSLLTQTLPPRSVLLFAEVPAS